MFSPCPASVTVKFSSELIVTVLACSRYSYLRGKGKVNKSTVRIMAKGIFEGELGLVNILKDTIFSYYTCICI